MNMDPLRATPTMNVLFVERKVHSQPEIAHRSLDLMAFVKIISQAHLPTTNEARNFPCSGKMICIVNAWGKITAMDNECLHQGGSLGQGMVEDGNVVCPW